MDAKQWSKWLTIANLTLIALLAIAWFKNPYSYYTFMRIASLLIFSGNLFFFLKRNNIFFIFGAVLFGILYNPIFPFHLGRSNWETVNLITAIYLIATIIYLRRIPNKTE